LLNVKLDKPAEKVVPTREWLEAFTAAGSYLKRDLQTAGSTAGFYIRNSQKGSYIYIFVHDVPLESEGGALALVAARVAAAADFRRCVRVARGRVTLVSRGTNAGVAVVLHLKITAG